ncbi:MFS permease [hydrothermal vent metagenome]|uniref:MFS permease n=1 Tax=hydrothermal vent metagenome TaxID=652676 RepID=A0A1W1ECG6_9ZZZZ
MQTIKFGTKVTLLLISMLTMMSNVAVVTILPHLSKIYSSVPNIEFLSRMMITLPSLAIAFLAPFLSSIIYKYGKRNSAIFALIFFAITGTAGLYLNGIYEILLSRFLLGIAIATLMIVSTTLVGDYFKDEQRHKFMGMQSAFVSIGGIFFIVGGGVLSDINWRYPFAIYGVGIVVLFFAIKYIVEYKNQEYVATTEALNHKLYKIYIMAFILMVTFFIVPTQLPYLMINEFSATGKETGFVIASAFLFNAVGGLSFIKLKKYFDYRKIYMIGMSTIAIGFIFAANVHEFYQFFIAAPIIGFGGGILFTNMPAWLLHYAHPSRRIKATSYLTSSMFLGQFFSPILMYPIVHYVGIKLFFEIIGISIIMVLLLTILIEKILNLKRKI